MLESPGGFSLFSSGQSKKHTYKILDVMDDYSSDTKRDIVKL